MPGGAQASDALPSCAAAPAGGSNMRILVVDDDPIGSKLVTYLLSEQGYEVETVDNAPGALALIERHPPDLMLLDIMLPGMDGLEVARRLHEADYDLPIIFVTGRGDLEDKLHGLQLGADDYICKPFQPAELTARVDAVLRRYRRAVSGERPQLRAGGLKIEVAATRVTLPDHRSVLLTLTEMKVLLQLAERPGQVVRRDDLLERVWGENYVGGSNVVDVYIGRLRRKLERNPAQPKYILTERGVGYRLVEG
jgi:DNA-binding response OmpR family regulator